MDVMYKNCCGLDVHKKIIKACIVTGKSKKILEFGTMTEDIISLVDWIKEKQCECVAMESIKKSSKTTKGNEFLRTTLVECAKAAAHTKDTYLSSQYHRIAARRGANRASVAVAHTILVIIYHIIKSEKPTMN